MVFHFEDEVFTDGLTLLEPDYGFLDMKGNFSVTVRKGESLSVLKRLSDCVIEYTTRASFFRAAGILAENIDEDDFYITESVNFKTKGVMFDVSQGNAAMNIKSCKSILRKMSVMGLNMLMLYCEDSYVIKEYPYFGYMRAKYTQEEFSELDEYAYALGIEMIPCIQTLAHLYEALKWDAFKEIRQDRDTLLVGEEKAYKFIETAIKTASAPFRSKKINIGMDEAWNLGWGEYYTKHGLRNSFDIMSEHLERVLSITRKLGLKPMMWCDMFFRAIADGDYYNADSVLTPEYASKMPSDVDYIYWDYYHDDESFYDTFIKKFDLLGKKPVFAGGVWSWYGYAVNWGLTFATMLPALKSCLKNGVDEVFLTVWGDNGTESNLYANLPALQLFAEFGYGEYNEAKYKKRFKFCCKSDFEDFYALRLLDEIPGVAEGNPGQCNASKYLMWNDILSGLVDYNIKNLPLSEHYKKLTPVFKKASKAGGEIGNMFRLYYLLSSALEYKAESGLRLCKAYKEGKESLSNYKKNYLPELKKRLKKLHSCHREEWFRTYKQNGWDILDMRYAAAEARIDSAGKLINLYLSGEIDHIEELEEKRLPYNNKEGIPGYLNHYGWICSASRIAPEH